MPTFEQELARMLWLKHENKISPDEPCKVVLPRLEAKEAARKPKGRTRFIFETDSEDMYSRFVTQKNRWLELIPNKSVALDMMCSMWENCSDAVIKAFGDEEGPGAP